MRRRSTYRKPDATLPEQLVFILLLLSLAGAIARVAVWLVIA